MDDYVHFDGDPAVDSQRRHLERVIKGHPPRRRWPWFMAAVAGGGLWAAWRTVQRHPPEVERQKPGEPERDVK